MYIYGKQCAFMQKKLQETLINQNRSWAQKWKKNDHSIAICSNVGWYLVILISSRINMYGKMGSVGGVQSRVTGGQSWPSFKNTQIAVLPKSVSPKIFKMELAHTNPLFPWPIWRSDLCGQALFRKIVRDTLPAQPKWAQSTPDCPPSATMVSLCFTNNTILPFKSTSLENLCNE